MAGMGYGNHDNQTKTINLEAIKRLSNSERDIQILNVSVVRNDSVWLQMTDSLSAVLTNFGPKMSYDLNIMEACDSLFGQYMPDTIKIFEDIGNTGVINDSFFVMQARITIPANSTHYIVPDWKTTKLVTGIKTQSKTGISEKFSLLQNYPNPFQTITTIKYRTTESGFVSLKVFNSMGTEVASLVNEQKSTGEYSVEWNAVGFESGIYFCKLQNGKFSDAKTMLITH
jgi:hypothetical protein